MSSTEQSKGRFILAVDNMVRETLQVTEPGWTASPDFVLTLCEAVMTFVSDCVQPDLLAFANHAKRKTVNMEDVLLLSRRSPALTAKIRQLLEEAGLKRAESSKNRKSAREDDITREDSKKKKAKPTLVMDDDDEDEEEGATQDKLDSDMENASYNNEDIFAD